MERGPNIGRGRERRGNRGKGGRNGDREHR